MEAPMTTLMDVLKNYILYESAGPCRKRPRYPRSAKADLKLSGVKSNACQLPAPCCANRGYWSLMKPPQRSIHWLKKRSLNIFIKDVSSKRNQITIMISLPVVDHHACRSHLCARKRRYRRDFRRCHESLLEEKGLYYAMWRQQIGQQKDWYTRSLIYIYSFLVC